MSPLYDTYAVERNVSIDLATEHSKARSPNREIEISLMLWIWDAVCISGAVSGDAASQTSSMGLFLDMEQDKRVSMRLLSDAIRKLSYFFPPIGDRYVPKVNMVDASTFEDLDHLSTSPQH
jgi:hypothetical protein